MKSRPSNGLSICVPNWNHRNYLARAIKSAFRAAEALKGHDLECQVIVVDDFSRDGSQRLLASMCLMDGSQSLDVILSPENKGLGHTRNIALRHARYRHVCVMDADNELVPENLHTFWRAARDTGAAMIYGNLVVRQNQSPASRLLSNDYLLDAIYANNYVDAFCLIDADQVNLVGGYYGKHAAAHEDWELLLHLVAEDKDVVFVPAIFGHYHVADLSMIQTTQYDFSKMRRVYSQRFSGLPIGYQGRKLYHPDIGWL